MRKDLFDKVRKYMVMGGMALAMLFCLTACGDNKYDNNGNNTPAESTSPKDDSDIDESTPEDKTENNSSSDSTITYEKSYEIEDNGDGKLESSISFSGDGEEQIEEGSD